MKTVGLCFSLGLVLMVLVILILVIPGPTKEKWVLNDHNEANGFMQSIFFPASRFSFGEKEKELKLPSVWKLANHDVSNAWLVVNLKLIRPLHENTEFLVYLQNAKGLNILTGSKSPHKHQLQAGKKHFKLLNTYIGDEENSDLTLRITSDSGLNYGHLKLRVFR